MSTAKEALKLACLGLLVAFLCLLCAVLAPFAWNSRATYRKVTAILLHVDGLTGEARLAAKASVTASKDTDKAIVAFGKLVDGIGETNRRAGKTITALGETAGGAGAAEADLSQLARKLSQTADAATRRIDALETTQAKANQAISAVADALTPVPAAISGLTTLEHSIDGIVSDPNIPLAVSHVNGAAAAVQGVAEDGREITGSAKHLFTWPKSLWNKIHRNKGGR